MKIEITKGDNIFVFEDSDVSIKNNNSLAKKLYEIFYEQVEWFFQNITTYLGVEEDIIDSSLIFKNFEDLPEDIVDIKTHEEYDYNALILKLRLENKSIPEILLELLQKIKEHVKNATDTGDFWNNRSDYELGQFQVINDLTKTIGLENLEEMSEIFRFSNIGDNY